ncbi:MAG: Flavohemoprotein [Planctomycetota bacterium]
MPVPELLVTGTALTLLGWSGWQMAETVWESWSQASLCRLRQQEHARIASSKIEQARLDGALKSVSNASSRWRQMVIAEMVDESSNCRSFYLEDTSGESLPSFLPGQHLLIQLPVDKHGRRPLRCYSLSDAPDSRYWRLTIKRIALEDQRADRSRHGLSDYLHSELKPGDSLLVRGPQGHFHVDPQFEGPLVLLAAGIGITPMVSMARWSLMVRPGRPIHLFYQVRNSAQHPFAATLHRWKQQRHEFNITNFYSRPNEDEIQGIHFDEIGRFDVESISKKLPSNRSKFYLCGPNDWMIELESQLLAHGIDQEDIAWESFGGLPAASTVEKMAESTGKDLTIRFKSSDKTALWTSEHKSLLELAESEDIAVDSGCRSGACGACLVKKICGKVRYTSSPSFNTGQDETLLCVAVPEENVEIDL